MGNSFKNILVPTDFSEVSLAILRTAAAMATKYGAAMHVVSVVDSSVYAYAGYPYADISNELVMTAKANIEKMKLPANAKGLKVHRAILEGEVGEELAAYCSSEKIDVVAMTSHARGKVAKFFVGSVADRLITTLPCPMLVSRAPEGTPKHPARRDRGFKKILLPTDFSATAEAGFSRAFNFARDYGAELHLLHVVDDRDLHLLNMVKRREALTEMRKRTQEQIQQVKSAASQGVKIVTSIAAGNPVKKIVSYAATNLCDLVVMGTHGRGEFKKLLLGSVADGVLRTAHCPIFLERPPKASK